MRKLVDAGERPGLLAYRDGVPVGWVSVAPREQFSRIERSRVLGPVDDEEVWSVVCFFIHRKERGSGVGAALLKAAVDAAAKRGARIVEGYPVDPRGGKTSNGSAFTGVDSMFRDAGFEEVERRSAGRPIMRRRLTGRTKARSRL
jgi:GNAT superfamily N-acetyltransferase